MKVGIAQVYVKAGVGFPFSHLMQRFVSSELSAAAEDCVEFQKKYGADFDLTVWVSADTGSGSNRIVGPGVYKKTKDVEYSVFLPFDAIVGTENGCRAAMEFLLAGVRAIFLKAGIDPAKLDERTPSIIDHVCFDPTMLKGPWPTGRPASKPLH